MPYVFSEGDRVTAMKQKEKDNGLEFQIADFGLPRADLQLRSDYLLDRIDHFGQLKEKYQAFIFFWGIFSNTIPNEGSYSSQSPSPAALLGLFC